MKRILIAAAVITGCMAAVPAPAAMRGMADGTPACSSPSTIRDWSLNMRAGNVQAARRIFLSGGCIVLSGIVNVERQAGGMVCAKPFGAGYGCYWMPRSGVRLGW